VYRLWCKWCYCHFLVSQLFSYPSLLSLPSSTLCLITICFSHEIPSSDGTNRCTDTSDPRHFGTGAEVSIAHFGTTVKIRDTSAPVPHFGTTLWQKCRSVLDISASLILRTQKCHINLFVQERLLYWWLMTHISVLFIYYIINYFVQGNQHTTNRVSVALVIS